MGRRGRRRARSLATAILLTILVGAGVLADVPAAAAAGTTLYPDLKTLPPRSLKLDRADVSADGTGQMHNVLRFSNTAWNAGEGSFVLRAAIDPTTKSGTAYQRIYDTGGAFVEQPVGTIYYHAVHNHYHFEGWGRYELWTKSAYDAWVASGRTTGSPQWTSPKTTSCVLDEEAIDDLPATPASSVYSWQGCTLGANGTLSMGLSPGWGDTYDYYRFEQWIDLNQSTLGDGQYVLRSVTDPTNVLWESDQRADPAREADNEATTAFSITGGAIQDAAAPSGTVWLNGVDNNTSNTVVNVRVVGRDDVSGVDQIRISNDGVTWKQQQFTGVDSTPMELSWDIADPQYGGSSASGTHTVSVQLHDVSGKWSSTITDTIDLVTCAAGTASSGYASTVTNDAPVSWWRLGEACGTSARDERGANNGTYSNGPTLAQPSLLAADGASTAVRFDGVDDNVSIPSSTSLALGSALSLEAWIKPASLPATGGWASVLTKAEAYSLQFNGSQLELTIMQNGARMRVKAPAGAVPIGSVTHVVGTYDGTTARLYLNGNQVATLAMTGAASTSSSTLQIGSWSGASELFNGVIDDVAVYNRALTPSSIANHNTAGRTTAPMPPTAPTNATATAASASSINVMWTDTSNNETGIVYERSTSSSFTSPVIKTFPPDVTSYTDTGLAPDTTYFCRIKATNGTGESAYSNVASATTQSNNPPPPPTGYAAAVTPDAPTSWWRLGEASGTTAADQRGANAGTYTNGPALGQASLLDLDTASTAVGFDGTNDNVNLGTGPSLTFGSAFSVEAWVRPAALPAAGAFASILTKSESYSLQLNGPRLEFTIMQGGARRRLQAPAGAVVAGTTYHVVGTYDGTTQRLYVNGALAASAALTGVATATSNPLLLASWDGGSEFFNGTIDEVAVYGTTLSAARVAAHTSAGRSSTPPPPTPPAAPSNLAASATVPTRVDATWTDNASNETAIVLERSTTSTFTAVTTVSLAANTTTYADTTASPSTTYYLRVKATNGAGSSAYSGTATVTTPAAPTPPAAPSNLTASAASSSRVDASWTDNASNETAIVLERSTTSTFTAVTTVSLAANTTTYADTTASPSTTYYLRVKASNGAGSSAYSNVVSVTTPAAPAASAYATAVAADNPTSWWRFGEASGTTAADGRGTNTGTYTNGPTLGQASLLPADTASTSVRLDGTNDYVNVPSAASLNLTNAFSIEAWIRPSALPAAGSFASVLTKAESYSIQLNGPRLEFTIMQSGARRRLQAPAGAVVAGTTYHVVATYDGTTQRLYVNGAQVASAALSGGATVTTSAVRIGSWDGGSEFFNGMVDEVALYSTVLTATQVANHNTKGRTG